MESDAPDWRCGGNRRAVRRTIVDGLRGKDDETENAEYDARWRCDNGRMTTTAARAQGCLAGRGKGSVREGSVLDRSDRSGSRNDACLGPGVDGLTLGRLARTPLWRARPRKSTWSPGQRKGNGRENGAPIPTKYKPSLSWIPAAAGIPRQGYILRPTPFFSLRARPLGFAENFYGGSSA